MELTDQCVELFFAVLSHCHLRPARTSFYLWIASAEGRAHDHWRLFRDQCRGIILVQSHVAPKCFSPFAEGRAHDRWHLFREMMMVMMVMMMVMLMMMMMMVMMMCTGRVACSSSEKLRC